MTAVMRPAVIWDQHACAALEPNADLSALHEFRDYADFVSLNVGTESSDLAGVVRVIAGFRAWIDARPEAFTLVASVDDVLRAHARARLAVAFDLEGIGWIGEQLELIEVLARLGVRAMLLTYNDSNPLASGCADRDTGLTSLGREAVLAMNRAGVIVDCSHTGRRATLEMMERSEAPVIFSHSNPAALWPHFRNIDDDQIRACAATGGVIGINGVNWFLGVSEPSADAIVRAVEHVGSLVGFAHVGLGLDYLFDPTEAEGVIAAWPQLAEERLGEVAVTGPSVLPEVARQLEAHGHDTETIGAIMGGNFLRVASEVWSVSAQHEDGT